ncbi:MAG: hypothetical protein R3E18_12550 [Sphingomonadaceae bacterium]
MSNLVFHPKGETLPATLLAGRVPTQRSGRWRPGLEAPLHSELFASGRDAGGAGLALSLALDALRHAGQDALAEVEDRRAVLWVQDREAMRRSGRPYRPGLPRSLQHRLIHVATDKPEDALFALEEGLRCRDLACVIGELAGNPRALSFTASRRLSLAAEKHGVPLFLIRLDAVHDLSSARMRWDVACAPSLPPRWNAQAPGVPRWHASLFRSRSHASGEWILRDGGERLVADPAASRTATPDPVDLAGAAGARSLAAG